MDKLKFEINEDNKLQIAENDRGEWKAGATFSCGEEFIGFNGENTLLLISERLQSGDWDVTVVHSRVDDRAVIGSSFGKDRVEAINDAVGQVYSPSMNEEGWIREKVAEAIYYQNFLPEARDRVVQWAEANGTLRGQILNEADMILSKLPVSLIDGQTLIIGLSPGKAS